MKRSSVSLHSRLAAAFNRLSHYPDDANVKFNFNFDIKSVFAIAPVDGQYRPAGVPTPIENVNYMVIHGSHDGDVSSFNGLRAFQRIKFTDGKPWFKTAWYVYRANHGQWNTQWGNKDNGPRSGRYLDLRGLITPEEQRQFSKVTIGAFQSPNDPNAARLRENLLRISVELSARNRAGVMIAPANALMDLEDPNRPIKLAGGEKPSGVN